MQKTFTLLLITALSWAASAQITITQADIGQAGDSMIVGNVTPTSNISVGPSGNQTWNFNFPVDDINTLKFEFVANTASGSAFPNADLAIERLNDTIFFKSNANAFILDGISGDAFGFGASMIADFNPDATQITFPSTYGTTFTDTAVFDTVVSCAAFGQGGFCDSAHIRRTIVIQSEIDGYGQLNTSGGSYVTIRQYLKEINHDSAAILNVIFGNPIWTTVIDSFSTTHNYRWYANGEKWPVLSAIADAQNGNITSAEFQIDDLLAYVPQKSNPTCFGGCDGAATVAGLGADPPYSYKWPAAAGGVTTASASGLCAGTYLVTITDNDTDSTVVEVVISNPPAIQISGVVKNESAGSDGAIDITVSGGSSPYTYQWAGPDGFTANTADIDSLSEGSYTVTVTDSKGCDTSRTFVIISTGIGSGSSSLVKVFPNPANNRLVIRAEELSPNSVAIFNSIGVEVFSSEILRDGLSLDISHWAEGVYVVRLFLADGEIIRKITVVH
ncbi:MAG: hypothetical protein Kow0075_04110 [Salibacteraceae bacterium]